MKVVLLLLVIFPLNSAKLRGVSSDSGDVGIVGTIYDVEETEYINETRRTHISGEQDRIHRDERKEWRWRRAIRGHDIYHRDERASNNIFSGQSRIIGGTEASSLQGDYSFAVSLQDQNGKHFCGASLVSKDCILTTAHCTNKVTGNSQITAVVGRYNLADTDEGEKLNIKLEKLHPMYDVEMANVAWDYDFAIMCFTKPTLSNARIIQLNKDSNFPAVGGLVRVMGWGDTNPNENIRTPSNKLQVASLRTVSNSQCDGTTGTYGTYSISFKGQIENSMMCAWSETRDACQGDSGGPLIHRGKLVGLTSWGVGCNDGKFPGVYARVSSAYNWIRRNICSFSMYPDPSFQCESLQD
jgi:trypsin